MYETRKELIKKMHDLCEDLNECEVELESKKEPNDINRRLDRLEECISMINHRLHNHKIDSKITPRTMERLNSIVIDMREEQAASKGDQEEEKDFEENTN